MDLISIVVPVYNVEDYLPSLIKSVLESSYTRFELILINDASDDSSGIICTQWAEMDNRISVIHLTSNHGAGYARNIGLDAAKGDYIVLCDGDDMIHPLLLENAHKIAVSSDFDCVIYGYQRCEENALYSTVCNQTVSSEFEEMDASTALKEAFVGSRFRMLAWNKLYKSELWKTVRFKEGRVYGDDTTVTFKLLDKCNKIAYVESSYYFYRNRSNSLINTVFNPKRLQIFDAYDEIIAHMIHNRSEIIEYAYYAYIIRVFDTFAMIDENKALSHSETISMLKEMRKYIKHIPRSIIHKGEVRTCTVNQWILMKILMVSPEVFLKVYTHIC